ncbi:hypothetical protein BDZ85DRAFT_15749 [Elsinoe ampelina]|uniref:Uncharacterized protein n=1 Tax=Elsinoe ampelina TaxID=302913 RepID=A0A6A6G6T0_9PEZI|nr:hypothetical protein BDZ85DRAFT_15749 [Elsinoe ampelina]
MRYFVSSPDAPHGATTRSWNWTDLTVDWGLNLFSKDHNAISRRLMMSLLTEPQFSSCSPSLPETLAVLAGPTVILSSRGSPVGTFPWNYSDVDLFERPQPQYFNISIEAREYVSGGITSADKAFLIVLLLTFLGSAFVLGYFIFQKAFVTDITDPPNLFSLALNSPYSGVLAGSCGSGPHGRHFKTNWALKETNGHFYMASTHNDLGHKRATDPASQDGIELDTRTFNSQWGT